MYLISRQGELQWVFKQVNVHSNLDFRKVVLLYGVESEFLVRELVIICRKLLDCIKSVRQREVLPVRGGSYAIKIRSKREKISFRMTPN